MTNRAEKLKLIFIFGIEPYAQILTLAVCTASRFIFKSPYTDGPGAGNYPCALGTPGFGDRTALKRLLAGCLVQGCASQHPWPAALWRVWTVGLDRHLFLGLKQRSRSSCGTAGVRDGSGEGDGDAELAQRGLSHPNISVPDMKDILMHSQSFAGQSRLRMSSQHRLWQPGWPEMFVPCSPSRCECVCPSAVSLVMPWKHLQPVSLYKVFVVKNT